MKLKKNTVHDQYQRIVVIGQNGFIGSSVISKLKLEGIETIGVGRNHIDFESKAAPKYFHSLLKSYDKVIFAAGDVPVKNTEQFEANLIIIRHFLEGSQGKKLSQLVYVSSDAVYKDSDIPLTENSIRAPETLHGLMHLTREVILQSSEFAEKLSIVRPTLIYGAMDPHNGYGPSSFMKLAQNFKPIVLYGEGEELRDFVHISDVAEIICDIVNNSIYGQVNIATGIAHTFLEVAQATAKILDIGTNILNIPRTFPIPHNGYRPFDISKLRKLFPEHKFRSLEEGLILMNQAL